MTLHDLMQALTAADLYPIPVEGEVERESIRGLSFVGNLEAFIQAAKALNTRCVFVTSRTLEERDFLYQEGEVDGGRRYKVVGRRELRADLYSDVDLRGVESSLNEFADRLGCECGYLLAVHSPTERLEYILHLEWWKRFSELRERAIEKILQERDLAESKQNEAEEKRTQQILNGLRGLINDPDFVRLPTQRAMQAYAFERIGDLDTLSPTMLKTEIQ